MEKHVGKDTDMLELKMVETSALKLKGKDNAKNKTEERKTYKDLSKHW